MVRSPLATACTVAARGQTAELASLLTPVSLCSSGHLYPSMGHDLDQKKVTLATKEHGTKNNWGQKRAVFVSLFSLRLALIRSGWISLPLVFGRDRLYTSSRANQLLIRKEDVYAEQA